MIDPEPDPSGPPVSHRVLILFNSPQWQPEQQILEALCVQIFNLIASPYSYLFEVSVLFTADDEIQKLNADYRGKDKPTNVLSFPSGRFPPAPDVQQPPYLPLGDVVLAYETIEREAQEQQKSFQDHLTHLLIHGFLHLLGYDHEDDEEATIMEDLERQYLMSFGIENPYLVRE